MLFFDTIKKLLTKSKKSARGGSASGGKIEKKPEVVSVTPQPPQKPQVAQPPQPSVPSYDERAADLARRTGALEEKEKYLVSKDNDLKQSLLEIENLKKDFAQKLEKAAGLTRDEAKALILKATEDRLSEDIAKRIKEAEIAAEEGAGVKAKEILIEAMRRGAIDWVTEYSVSTVKIKDEEMKGRIIGKEGRNIRAFETATGVDVDLDEEGVIRLSSFDSVRREIARVALEKLMVDGRIQPVRIEELVEQTKKEIEKIMFEEGEKLAHSVGVFNLPKEVLDLLGRFKYRFSYGQNMITHTLEETRIGIALATELKANINIVRLGCLLHDIGKIITEEEGSHVNLGVELLRKHHMPEAVIACVAEHHEDKPFSSIESMIVYLADAVSGARPGARYEDYEEYLKRLGDLESIAKSKNGVREAYAFQAGREIRVIVDPGKLDDAAATILAHQLKGEIADKITVPGQVKITVIRELRITETA